MSELAEAESLLAKATFPAIQKLLQDHISSLKVAGQKSDKKISDLEQPPKANVPAPVALPSVVLPVADVAKPATAAAAKDTPAVAANASPVVPVRTAAVKGQSLTYIPIEDFAWDQGEYGSNTVSIFVDLTGVGAVKDRVEFSCTKSSFDLKVTDLNGKNYRLIKENLDKDIIVSESKIVVKKDKVVIKLRKLKGEYSYENWTSLTAKKKRDTASEADKKANPMGGIMDMMKDMYDDGDENMKKIIGEAMMKSQRGEKPETPAYDDM
jgi:calcyclin binding protein